MEGCRCLADFLAITAGELFPHSLNNLSTPRYALHRFGDVFAELVKPSTATAATGNRTRHNDTLTRQMFGKGFLDRPIAHKAGDRDRCGSCNGHFGGKFIFGRRRLGVLKHQLQLRNQPRLRSHFSPRSSPLQLFDIDLLTKNDGLIVGLLALGNSQVSQSGGPFSPRLRQFCFKSSGMIAVIFEAGFYARSESHACKSQQI